MTEEIVIGVDVGGTNTDCVLFERGSKEILSSCKTNTTEDVTTGITTAVRTALGDRDPKTITALSIGTTAFVNALLERRKLAKVAVIRLCGISCTGIVPFETIPVGLRNVLEGYHALCAGGYEFTGIPISEVNEAEIHKQCEEIKNRGIHHIVISGVFSPISNEQEVKVKDMMTRYFDEAKYAFTSTVSSEIATLGLIERENASILNETLKPLACRTVQGFQTAFEDLQLTCPFFLCQNDGTLISAERAMEYPIFCISSGPTNSARGASFLTGVKDGIFVDIGGTSADIGVIMNGFPRQSQVSVNIAGVRTNFRMPDVYSIALGGGSIIKKIEDNSTILVGPESVGYMLPKKSRVFGGDVLTTSDIATLVTMGRKHEESTLIGISEERIKLQKEISEEEIHETTRKIHQMTLDGIDMMKSSDSETVPVILVGGGSMIITDDKGEYFEYIRPPHFSVANAVGAAIAQVSSEINILVSLKKAVPVPVNKEETQKIIIDETFREEVLEGLRKKVIQKAVDAGASEESVEIVVQKEIEIGYVGGVTGQKRVIMKAIGDIKEFKREKAKFFNNSPNNSKENMMKQEMEEILKNDQQLALAQQQPLKKTTTTSEEKNSEEILLRIGDDYKPHFVDGVWTPDLIDLKCISLGAGVLGCGGGGPTFIGEIVTKKYLGRIRILRMEDMPDEEGSVVPAVGFIGAPSVANEKLTNMTELETGIIRMKKYFQEKKTGEKLVGITAVEIGGFNSMTPLYTAAQCDLPLFDCDMMGRAFPEIQMMTQFIFGDKYNPSVMSNEKGESVVVDDSTDCHELEKQMRALVFSKYYGVGGFVCPPLNKKQVQDWAIPNTYSQAWRIGKGILVARAANKDPVQAIFDAQKSGKLIYIGKITYLDHQVLGGFDKVILRLKGLGEFSSSEALELIVHNENLVAKIGKEVVACVPDLISLVNPDDGSAIQTDSLQYGLRCSCIVMPICEKMKSQKALEVVGPKGFNLKEQVEYTPCGHIEKNLSVYDEFGGDY